METAAPIRLAAQKAIPIECEKFPVQLQILQAKGRRFTHCKHLQITENQDFAMSHEHRNAMH